MNLYRNPRVRAGASLLVLAGVFALSLTVPIPSLPDGGRQAVMREVGDRLPGWSVERLDPSWEGAYTVVAFCAGRQMGFQFVPGHGLPGRDAWLQPNDEYTRERLVSLSDHWRNLVWYDDPALFNTLSCDEEIAGNQQTSMDARRHD
ncbi:MAG: hypothetical protein ACR2GO_02455 [Candidatus Limnocylindria bacterium]